MNIDLNILLTRLAHYLLDDRERPLTAETVDRFRRLAPGHQSLPELEAAQVQPEPEEPTGYHIETRQASHKIWENIHQYKTRTEAWDKLQVLNKTGHKSFEYRMIAIYT